MNILIISKNSPFESIGGIERYISNLISYFKLVKNNEIKLSLMLATSGKDRTEEISGIKIYFTNSLVLSSNSQEKKNNLILKSDKFSEELVKIIKMDKIDIINAENFPTDLPPLYSLLLNMITMSRKIPVVLHIHSFAITQLQTELINQLKWDKISCVSKSVAGDCFQKSANINLLSTHYLGVNVKEFYIDEAKNKNLKKSLNLPFDSKIILTATRIIRGKRNILHEKGLICLIEAYSKLSLRYPKLYLVIAIGKPPENLKEEFNLSFEMLQGYIKLHNVEEKTILKMYNLDEMPDVYRGSDVFALPSENETFGQVFLEAMSCGLPVIGTKVGGIPEIISDSYNGYLVPPEDASILAQRIEHLMNNPQTIKKFISGGINTVNEKFTSTFQINEFISMLQKTYLESQKKS